MESILASGGNTGLSASDLVWATMMVEAGVAENPPGLADFLGKDLPLMRGAKQINFTVIRENGLSSNSWGVTASKQGDVYVFCRDHMQSMKISLHQSGRQFVAFTEQSREFRTGNDRRWIGWHEPQEYDGPRMVPSFNLFFPSWGLGLTEEVRTQDPQVWEVPQINVPAAESPLATTISFVITNSNLTMPFTDVEGTRLVPFGVLDARPGKKLWLVTRYESEDALKQLAINAIESANADPQINASFVGLADDVTFGMCVDGFNTGGIAFMMPFPATTRIAEGWESRKLIAPWISGPSRQPEPKEGFMASDPITYISVNLTPEVGSNSTLSAIRVVPAGQEGEIVFGRTLNYGEEDSGEGIVLQPGQYLVFPVGSLKITIQDIDQRADVGEDGYAAVANTVWSWLRIGPEPDFGLFQYLFAAARRLDSAHENCQSALLELGALVNESYIKTRERQIRALGRAEAMCVALNRATRMLERLPDKFPISTKLPSSVNSIGPALNSIRDAFEHVDERVFGNARRESIEEALTIFDQDDFMTSGILRYAGYSLDLRSDVLPALIDQRSFIYDVAVEKAGSAKTLNVPLQFDPFMCD